MTDSAVGVLGVDLDNTYSSAGALPFAQGEPVATKNGRAILGRAVSGIAQYSLVAYAPSSAGASASVDVFLASAANVSGTLLAVAQTSVNSAEYGWFHIESHKEGRIRCGVAETGVPLFLTTTGGQIDDALVSGKALAGLWILESVTSASAPRAIWRDIKLDRGQLA